MKEWTMLRRSKLKWLLSKRAGTLVFLLFFILTFRQLISSQLKLEKVNEGLSEKKYEYLSHNGAKSMNMGRNHFLDVKRIGNRTGLTVKQSEFYLNGKPFRILGGSIHYFRFPSEYWRLRLLALKASGLNTVTTYVAWNAHEPIEGVYDFTDMLDLPRFMQTAHDLDLYVILRVGPYICAEWEWGGLPSWLLRDPDMKVRTSDPAYMKHVENWFSHLLLVIKPYQYSHGGPVIAMQVENEYASFPNYDPLYVVKLRDMIVESGIEEFLFVCDDRNGILGRKLEYGGMMKSINFQHNAAATFKQLKAAQPDWPLFVSEYWTGWFNWWGGPNHNRGVPWQSKLDTSTFEKNTKEVLDAGGHMNMYMFAGGTNFGFLNGGMIAKGGRTDPDSTSYDYDAIITEEGKLTAKFHVTRKLLQALQPDKALPNPPPDPELAAYSSISIDSFVNLDDLLVGLSDFMIELTSPLPMELFGDKSVTKQGQAYGYAVYETLLGSAPTFELDLNGKIRDRAHVYLDAVYQKTVFPPMGIVSLKSNQNSEHTVRLLVENQGRINWVSRDYPGIYGNQRKGIIGDIKCNGQVLTDWKVWSLEFDAAFLNRLEQLSSSERIKWHKSSSNTPKISAPAIVRAFLDLDNYAPKDSFMELEGFEKGVVVVNHRNIGRFWNSAGPQKRLFLPGVWLHKGKNEILIFEEKKLGTTISFHKSNGMV